MANEDALPWVNLKTVTAAARAFLDPVLATVEDSARWDPIRASWQAP
jgi:hypothetical protein